MFDSQSDLVGIAVVYLFIIPTGRVVTFSTILSIGKKYHVARKRISVEEECIQVTVIRANIHRHTIRLIHFYFFRAQFKRHTRIQFIQTPGFISQNRSGDVSRKPARKRGAQTFPECGIVYRGAWRIFLHPRLSREESVFNFAQGYHWRSRADKTARERARGDPRAGTSLIASLAAHVTSAPISKYNIGNLSVSRLCSAKEGGHRLAGLETSVYITLRLRTPLTDAVSTPSLPLTSPEAACIHVHKRIARTRRRKLTRTCVDATTIAPVYLRGIELRGTKFYALSLSLSLILLTSLSEGCNRRARVAARCKISGCPRGEWISRTITAVGAAFRE